MLFERYTGRRNESEHLARLPHSSEQQTRKNLEGWSTAQSWENNNRLALVIEEKEQRSAIGQLTLFKLPGAVEFHFGISHDFSGKGYVTEVLSGLIESDLAANTILITYCSCEHPAAQRVLEKSGFCRTGFVAKKYRNPNQNNQWVDCFTYQSPTKGPITHG